MLPTISPPQRLRAPQTNIELGGPPAYYLVDRRAHQTVRRTNSQRGGISMASSRQFSWPLFHHIKS
jgi:hypothetical protein